MLAAAATGLKGCTAALQCVCSVLCCFQPWGSRAVQVPCIVCWSLYAMYRYCELSAVQVHHVKPLGACPGLRPACLQTPLTLPVKGFLCTKMTWHLLMHTASCGDSMSPRQAVCCGSLGCYFCVLCLSLHLFLHQCMSRSGSGLQLYKQQVFKVCMYCFCAVFNRYPPWVTWYEVRRVSGCSF